MLWLAIDIRQSTFGNPCGGIAQLVERQLCKLDVRGSNPLASKAWVAHASRVLVSASRRNNLQEKFANPRRLRQHARRVRYPTKTKNAGRLLAIRHFDVQQQRLNCALIVVSSSLGFFRFQGLNGISEIPKNFGLSRRPIQSLLKSKLFKVTNSP